MASQALQQKKVAEPTSVDRQVESVRQFNRFYTRQLGLLDQGYLSSGWTLTEARVLYELARRSDVTAAKIADELQLDVAYLSRILASFEKKRLLNRTGSRADARQRNLALTAKGRAAFQPLERAAGHQGTDMLAPLPEAARANLVSAMHQVQALLERKPAAEAGYTLRALQCGD